VIADSVSEYPTTGSASSGAKQLRGHISYLIPNTLQERKEGMLLINMAWIYRVKKCGAGNACPTGFLDL
jgi:hypothetical protein